MGDITTQDNGNGTSTWTFTDNTVQIRCNDCDRWARVGSTIVHSTRCDTHAQHTAPKEPAVPAIPQPRSANGLSSDELLAAVDRGYLTQSQAMNRDF